MSILATWIWILIVIVALIGGFALGFWISRKYMMDYLEKNPPINEDMLRMMMMQIDDKMDPTSQVCRGHISFCIT